MRAGVGSFDNALHQLIHVAPVKGMPATAGALVQEYTQCPHITLVVVWFVAAELGGKIVGRATHGVGHTQGVAQNRANAKVTELDRAILHEEYVHCFDITV